MPLKKKKTYHHGNLRDALVDAAERALSEMPLEKVSLREIARRAGVSHAAPKHHFGSLGNLFGEVAARGFDRFVASLDAAASRANQSPPHRLRAMAKAYLDFAGRNPAVYGLMFGKRDNVEPTPHLKAAGFTAWTQLEKAAAAIVGDARKQHGALAVWSAVHGLAMLRMDCRAAPHIESASAVDHLARVIVAGLQSETGS